MRSSIIAMLWENWRLTRVEAAWRLALGIVAASAVLVAFAAVAPNQGAKDFRAVVALVVIVLPHCFGWGSISKLNGARPGFPFYLLYAYPVRTAVMIGVPMAYFAIVPAAIYCVSALLLRVTFGYAFPLLPVAAWIAAFNLMVAATHWWTRNSVIRMLGLGAVSGAWTILGAGLIDDLKRVDGRPDRWSMVSDFPLAYYVLIGAVGLVSFGLTVVGVTRQRRGEGPSSAAWSPAGIRDRLASLFPFPCPTSSPTWAQVWFELRASGLPLLTIAVALAIVNPLLFAVSVPIDVALTNWFHLTCRVDGCFFARGFTALFAMLSVPAIAVLGANAFGIRAKQGRFYASSFEAMQPYGTGRLTVLKVLAMSVFVLTALAIVVGSAWASGLFTAASDVVFGDPRIWPRPRVIANAAGVLTSAPLLALVVVACLSVAVWVAWWASFGALMTRFPRRVSAAAILLLLYPMTLIALAMAEHAGIGPGIPFVRLSWVTSWVAVSAIVCTTAYLLWRVFVERLLTPSQVGGAILLSAVFAAAWLTLLRAVGASLTAIPAAGAVLMSAQLVMPLTISMLAPWSYSSIRHT